MRGPSREKGVNYIVQTNHDSDVLDPDGRSTMATEKIQRRITENNEINSFNFW